MDNFLKHVRTFFYQVLCITLYLGFIRNTASARYWVPDMYMLNNKSGVIMLPREAVIELNCAVPFSLFAAGTIV